MLQKMKKNRGETVILEISEALKSKGWEFSRTLVNINGGFDYELYRN